MKKSRSIVLGAALALAAFSVGCTAAAPEPKGSSSSKLLAPKAMFKVKSTLETKQALGISEWRIYRGAHAFVLTGYDAHGDAVKGVSLGFMPQTKSAKASLKGRFLDGSYFAARHDYGAGTHANGSMGSDTKQFVTHAISDMKTIGTHFHFGPFDPNKGGTTTTPAPAPTLPTTPTLPTVPPIGMDPGQMDCAGDMMGTVMAALQCLQSGAGTDPNAILACVMASQGAVGAGGTCNGQGTIQPPYDPTDPTGGAGYPGGQYPYPGDPTGGAYPGDPTGGAGYPGDPTGGAGYPGGAGDPYGNGFPGGGDPYGQMGDPQAGGMLGGMDPSCPSCPPGSGYGDIYGDPMNGDVGLGDAYGDMGGDYGAGY